MSAIINTSTLLESQSDGTRATCALSLTYQDVTLCADDQASNHLFQTLFNLDPAEIPEEAESQSHSIAPFLGRQFDECSQGKASEWVTHAQQELANCSKHLSSSMNQFMQTILAAHISVEGDADDDQAAAVHLTDVAEITNDQVINDDEVAAATCSQAASEALNSLFGKTIWEHPGALTHGTLIDAFESQNGDVDAKRSEAFIESIQTIGDATGFPDSILRKSVNAIVRNHLNDQRVKELLETQDRATTTASQGDH